MSQTISCSVYVQFYQAKAEGRIKGSSRYLLYLHEYQGESVNILLNFTQFFETRIEYRFQI
ncbi:hypothetical protein, partial [Aeromonas salmonicida]|uniref:hypothetical protein n=1 Tax=Aeromonas salmonicida TaxID=645 RepID=UPI0019550839